MIRLQSIEQLQAFVEHRWRQYFEAVIRDWHARSIRANPFREGWR